MNKREELKKEFEEKFHMLGFTETDKNKLFGWIEGKTSNLESLNQQNHDKISRLNLEIRSLKRHV